MFPVIETRDAFQKASERLLNALREQGMIATPNQALNFLSRVCEAKDWNTVSAALKAREKASVPSAVSPKSREKVSVNKQFEPMNFPRPLTQDTWNRFLAHAHENGIFDMNVVESRCISAPTDYSNKLKVSNNTLNNEDITAILKILDCPNPESFANGNLYYSFLSPDNCKYTFFISVNTSMIIGIESRSINISARCVTPPSLTNLKIGREDILVKAFIDKDHGINIIAGGSAYDRQRLASGLILHACEVSDDGIKFAVFGNDLLYGIRNTDIQTSRVFTQSYINSQDAVNRGIFRDSRTKIDNICVDLSDSHELPVIKGLLIENVIPAVEGGASVSMCLPGKSIAGVLDDLVCLFPEHKRELASKRLLHLIKLIICYREIRLPQGNSGVVRECLVFDDNVRHALRRSPTRAWHTVITEIILTGRADSQPIQAYGVDPLHADMLPPAGLYPEGARSTR